MTLGRMVNHSINPNAEIIGNEVFALEDILYGSEITFNYRNNKAYKELTWQDG